MQTCTLNTCCRASPKYAFAIYPFYAPSLFFLLLFLRLFLFSYTEIKSRKEPFVSRQRKKGYRTVIIVTYGSAFYASIILRFHFFSTVDMIWFFISMYGRK
jgi:hypothetical protein